MGRHKAFNFMATKTRTMFFILYASYVTYNKVSNLTIQKNSNSILFSEAGMKLNTKLSAL